MPKLVFVGDGPARIELEQICNSKGYDAVFMGHRTGEELARCYASADVFAFPSFTEVSRVSSAWLPSRY
jgi:glycosyltransferase involved in cell wall biosynthesis